MIITESIRLVQLTHPAAGRSVALVQEPLLILLKDTTSIYKLALDALNKQVSIKQEIVALLSNQTIDYTLVYEGRTEWKILPSFDHPQNPLACMVSGTGLTHKNSALNRQIMHQDQQVTQTPSMQMYQWGLNGGHPENGTVGVQPEWFYKGTGHALRAHNQALEIPFFANDGGEEPEVAGAYIIDQKGKPWRIGFTTGNEFSDHVMEQKNYLYLAPSKLRSCSIGPELVIGTDFNEVQGTVSIVRNGMATWSKQIKSGELNMAHSLQNLEHHHFKYPGHRIPYQAHIHFYGADAFSFGDQIRLKEGDEMIVHWQQLGRPLKNQLQHTEQKETLVTVEPIF